MLLPNQCAPVPRRSSALGAGVLPSGPAPAKVPNTCRCRGDCIFAGCKVRENGCDLGFYPECGCNTFACTCTCKAP